MQEPTGTEILNNNFVRRRLLPTYINALAIPLEAQDAKWNYPTIWRVFIYL